MKINDLNLNEDVTDSNNRGNVKVNFRNQAVRSGIHTIYRNQKDNIQLTQERIERKEYIIEEPLKDLQWSIGINKMKISEYQCIEATSISSIGTKIVAWYAPDIPVNEGPSIYWGLPGLILYVNIDNGKTIFSCTSIKQLDNQFAINAPNEGEKISREHFNKIVEEITQRSAQERQNGQTRTTISIK